MSYYHISRLDRCYRESTASKYSIAYVEIHWESPASLPEKLSPVSIEDIQNATKTLDGTYTIRVFATFEALLKEYMDEYHSQSVSKTRGINASQLIDQVGNKLTPKLGKELQEAVHEQGKRI